MKTLKGNELSPGQQRLALSMFVHRFTGDHKPAWAFEEWKTGRPYPLQFKDDADWLANTVFNVKDSGDISARHNHCQSSPTWPNNPELRADAQCA